MRVLVVTNLYPPDVDGGYELGCAQVVTALRQHAHEVRVLTSAPRHPVPAEPGLARSLNLADVYDPDLGRPRDPARRAELEVRAMWIDAANVHRLLTELSEFQPDVVYLWNLVGLGGLGLAVAVQQAGVPWVWHLMDHVPAILSGLRGPARPPLARLFGDRLAGTYISCSDHVVEELRRNGVELGGRVEIVPNWVRGPREASPRRVRPEGALRIAMASTVSRYKGIDVMMRAAALLRARGVHDFSVDVYGRFADRSLIDLLEELDLAGCFFLRGEVPHDQLVELYDDYDLFAFPSWEREPFAFAALEPAARGCPVLMSHSGNAEWFVDGVHCLKAERTPEAFAAVIERVVRGELDAEAIGRRAQLVVLRDFHIDAVIGRIQALLEEAAARPNPATDHARIYRTALLAEHLASTILDEAATR